MEETLRAEFSQGFRHHHVPGSKIEVLARLEPSRVVNRFESRSLTIRELHVGPSPGILLAGVHFPSRVNWSREAQLLEATVLARDITRQEEALGHSRTLLLGDLNMNPFDPGVAGAHALHGVMTRRIAAQRERTVQGRSYRFFYNPMWGCLGDRSEGPAGSYYHASSSPDGYFWNTYDQVLLRPELMGQLADLRLLDSDGVASLLTPAGRPDARLGSDHLPILVRLQF